MRLAQRRRRHAGFILVVLFAASLAACTPPSSVNSPEVDAVYQRMYGPIIDGG